MQFPIEPYHAAHVSIQVSPVRDSVSTVTEEWVACRGMEGIGGGNGSGGNG